MGVGSGRASATHVSAAAALLGLAAAAATHATRSDTAAPSPAEAASIGVSSLVGAQAEMGRCGAGCSAVVYAWSPRMPLSRAAITHVELATETLGARLVLVRSEELDAYAHPSSGRRDRPGGLHGPNASTRGGATSGTDHRPIPLADQMLDAGALAHAPALVVYGGGEPRGPAILGYKSARAYERMIARRLGAEGAERATPGSVRAPDRLVAAPAGPTTAREGTRLVDYDAVGTPGAYFRWVPGGNALAYESGGRVYVLDLEDGRSRVAPGYIDFVPTPDGRYFVTPGPTGGGGLRFYDADEVFAAARTGRGERVQPFFTDGLMRDQYPSVGILEREAARTDYRVLTSWFEGIVYRDYEVRHAIGSGRALVRPLGETVVPCGGMSLSTPIMSQDGRELAARDERTGTTKVFRIRPAGQCDEVLDLGTHTSKVAWHATGDMLAFAVAPRAPRSVRPGQGGAADGATGVFLYDRGTRGTTRVADSGGASLFAFPDFIGEASLVFLITRSGRSSAFRVVEGIR